MERRARRAPAKARSRRGANGLGSGVGQRGRKGGLGETIAPQRFSGAAEEVGGRTHVFVDRPEQEDEQRLREAMCERRSVGVRCHDSPHAEAPCSHLRAFHTVSEGVFSEVRLQSVAYGPLPVLTRALPYRSATRTSNNLLKSALAVS